MKSVRGPSNRAKFPKISEEMQRVAAMIETEVRRWPSVTARPMFGMLGLYREGVMVAALPHTRALKNANSIILRFDPMPRELLRRAECDPRVSWEREAEEPRWYSFEVTSDRDISDALWWLSQAYEASGKRRA